MQIGAGNAIVLREFAIDLGGEVIFGCDLLLGKAEDPDIAIRQDISIRQRIEGVEKFRNHRIHLHGPCGKRPLPRRELFPPH